MNDNDTPKKLGDDTAFWLLGLLMVGMVTTAFVAMHVDALFSKPGFFDMAERSEDWRQWQQNPRRERVEVQEILSLFALMGMLFTYMVGHGAGQRGGFFPTKVYVALTPLRRAWSRTWLAWAINILAQPTTWPRYLPRVTSWSPDIHLLMIGALVIPGAFFMVEQMLELQGLMPKIYATSPFLYEALVWAAVVGFAVMVISILLVAVYFLAIVVCFSTIKVTKLIRASKIRWAVAIIQKRRRLTA
jgi:hypothetical protein